MPNEEQRWITDTPHRAQIDAMIMMYAGLRRGELIPLTWGDIDLQKRTIAVNKAVEMINGKSYSKNSGKTQNSMRIVDMPQRLVDFLLRIKLENCLDIELVCPSAKRSMLSGSGWKRLWGSCLTELNLKYGNIPEEYRSKYNPHGIPFNIPNITPHWLRHTFITLMYISGVDILTAKEQAGHAGIKTTLEIYTHLDKEYKRNSMNKLDEYLNEKNRENETHI